MSAVTQGGKDLTYFQSAEKELIWQPLEDHQDTMARWAQSMGHPDT